jgi:Pyridoxal-dependent decarboxylase conserved domain
MVWESLEGRGPSKPPRPNPSDDPNGVATPTGLAFQTRDGRVYALRRVRPADVGLLAEFVRRLSEQTRWLRFMAARPCSPEVARMVAGATGDSITLIVIEARGGSGAVVAVAELACAHDAGAWVYVDGAFGLWAAAAPSRAFLTAGMMYADSWATDAHKWLNVPYDSGLAFVRDAAALRAATAVTAAYPPTVSDQRNPSDYTPELSRRARGAEVWAALRSLGRAGLAALIDRTCCHARRFAERLAAAGYQVLNDVVLNQALVSFGDAETTNRVIAAIQADGTWRCGGTIWQGQTAMRISVSSGATTDEDVERSLAVMLRIAARYSNPA